MKMAVIQGNYIPWAGYFALMRHVDHFLIYEDVQYTKNDWRNRNIIIKNQSDVWLTIPVLYKHLGQRYLDTQIANQVWAKKHYSTLKNNFSKCSGWRALEQRLEAAYSEASSIKYLHEVNRLFIMVIVEVIGVPTKITRLTSRQVTGNPSADLVRVLQNYGASEYFSGPSAQAYIDEQDFASAGIRLNYVNYSDLINRELPWIGPARPVSIIQDILEKYDELQNFKS